MFSLVVEVVVVSIVVAIAAQLSGLVPRYAKWRHAIVMQGVNSGLLTALLSLFIGFDVRPSWVVLFVLICLSLWLSIHITGYLVDGKGSSSAAPGDQEDLDDSEKR